MSFKFKFKRTGNLFSWESDNRKIEFSEPAIETSSQKPEISSVKEIMYYYYKVRIYTKNRKWKKINEVSVYDFPSIDALKNMITFMLKDLDIIKDGQKIEMIDGDYLYRYTLDSLGFIGEDYYEITKEYNPNIKKNYYSVFIGCPFDFQGDVEFSGIKLTNITEEDIIELLNCVENFIQFSIDEYNEGMKKYIKNSLDSIKITQNKIYHYDCKEKDAIGDIIAVGDTADIDYIKGNGKNIEITDITGKIVDITKDFVIVERAGEEIKIDSNSILSVFEECDKKIHFTKEDIIKDFKKIMTSTDKKFFKDNTEGEIFRVYNEAIAARSWMYRDEHNFPKKIDDERENVKETIKEIINEIKTSL